MEFPTLLEIRPNQIDQILAKFRGNLFFCAVNKMETDVIFKHFTHQAVDTTTNRSQQHQLSTTVLISCQSTFNSIQLSTQFSDALQQFKLLAFMMPQSISLSHSILLAVYL